MVLEQSDVKMEMPAVIGDYTDFFSSKEHATNTGTIFRGKELALPPNWYCYPFLLYVPRINLTILIRGWNRKPNVTQDNTNLNEGTKWFQVVWTCFEQNELMKLLMGS